VIFYLRDYSHTTTEGEQGLAQPLSFFFGPR
jgi:hypothetical protein